MSLLAVVNPSRRRRKKGARSRRRMRRNMTANQLRYFGPKRMRSNVHRKRRRRSYRRNAVTAAPLYANPRRRRSRRSYRRNPAMALGGRRPAFRAGYIMNAVQDAGIGAGGALAVDFAMAQAARMLPATLTSRMNASGGINMGYYATKIAIAVGLGVLGTQMLPGARARLMAAKGVAGSLTIQAYEIVRAMLPADLVLGYFTPARVTSAQLGAYLRRPGVPSLRAYMPTGGGYGASLHNMQTNESRVGEGAIS